ncbi:MAG TPA: spore coat protein [Firmicutes bacterium]|nr:spore coat protein [Bacillota bacterium]
MKQSKKDIMLCEKDALQDLLDAEKLLMNYYATALTEGSCRPLRRQILKLYGEHADTQFSVFEQMVQRGYYQTQPAEKMMIDEKTESFSKVKKQLA